MSHPTSSTSTIYIICLEDYSTRHGVPRVSSRRRHERSDRRHRRAARELWPPLHARLNGAALRGRRVAEAAPRSPQTRQPTCQCQKQYVVTVGGGGHPGLGIHNFMRSAPPTVPAAPSLALLSSLRLLSFISLLLPL